METQKYALIVNLHCRMCGFIQYSLNCCCELLILLLLCRVHTEKEGTTAIVGNRVLQDTVIEIMHMDKTDKM